MVKTEKERGKVQLFFLKKKKRSGRRKITRTIVQERVCRPGRITQEKGRQQGKEGRLQQEQSLCASFFPPIRKRPMFQPRSTRTCLVLSKSPNLSELKSCIMKKDWMPSKAPYRSSEKPALGVTLTWVQIPAPTPTV